MDGRKEGVRRVCSISLVCVLVLFGKGLQKMDLYHGAGHDCPVDSIEEGLC